jgi:hypothetical protein
MRKRSTVRLLQLQQQQIASRIAEVQSLLLIAATFQDDLHTRLYQMVLGSGERNGPKRRKRKWRMLQGIDGTLWHSMQHVWPTLHPEHENEMYYRHFRMTKVCFEGLLSTLEGVFFKLFFQITGVVRPCMRLKVI